MREKTQLELMKCFSLDARRGNEKSSRKEKIIEKYFFLHIGALRMLAKRERTATKSG